MNRVLLNYYYTIIFIIIIAIVITIFNKWTHYGVDTSPSGRAGGIVWGGGIAGIGPVRVQSLLERPPQHGNCEVHFLRNVMIRCIV